MFFCCGIKSPSEVSFFHPEELLVFHKADLLAMNSFSICFLGMSLWLRQWSVCLQCGRPGFDPWVGRIPWRRQWQSTPALLPGESNGRRSLIGYSLWGRKESDSTEGLHFHFLLMKRSWLTVFLFFSSLWKCYLNAFWPSLSLLLSLLGSLGCDKLFFSCSKRF